MNESTFSLATFYHASYVAFAFSCLLFGALAFRQVLDNLEVRRMQLGEDFDAFLSPVACCAITAMSAVVVLASFLCYRIEHPTIYAYAFPMVLAVQTVQFALRTLFQRTNLKTRGIVIRSVLFGRVVGAPYDDIRLVEVMPEMMWLRVEIHGDTGMLAVFRIFRFSGPALTRLLQRVCVCPVRTA
jgi:hypothetical protein